ncbi:hypothetical protein TREMEDRAFT_73661 [Tremella mesenterica DSM 1558]|uniref:uncharacterized protein n=1 Tax=Tremella mesenterica (strain ATCC 24925 / CBS 8224 / DSM 1558 / NBRC 9311 / NRRL Y-6157 / RJB 2259-6 / UBC 559-6) TaxID=578456 RepID=UPI0003F4A4D1|nr:uncharacterized protein TREMEDRAFT_73661 [Tremella mesenterica DSM 1558]EIW69925.1 hypothetical protein TREMEDRAFT_73661 [Tremella mesenterica DSM 1558]
MAPSTSVPTAEHILAPETLLKKRRTTETSREAKLQAAIEARKLRKEKRKVIFKRAGQYIQEYRDAERETIRLKREARKTGDFFVPAQSKILFVVRLKGISKIAPKPKKILQLLRLLQINNGVFIRATKATLNMLQLVNPYVTYGEPNLKAIRELIYKRGYAKIDGQRIPITDNQIIEKQLGKHGIICMEDLVHEIATCGPNFKQATQALWPFKLSNPNGGWRPRKFIGYVENGDAGDRETNMSKLIHQMV